MRCCVRPWNGSSRSSARPSLFRVDEALATQISENRRIIAFRNILIHGYADVADRLVWDIIETKLPVLTREVAALLKDA